LLVGVCVAIGSALSGAGYWALVLMQISTAFCTLIGLWLVCDWRPGRPQLHTDVKNMLSFGGHITLFNIVNYFARNFDNILIGRVWGAGPLGVYSKAYGLLMLPLRQINMPLSSVAIPALSALYGDLPRYRSYYLQTISLITLVSTPFVGFLIICSDDLILLVLGPQWSAAGNIFAVLGISALVQPLYFTQGWLHVSAGRGDRYLRWGIISSILIVLSFIVGLPYGPLGVATAYGAVTWAIIVPCMWYAGRSAGIGLKFIFNAVSKNIASGLGSIAISYVLLENFLFFESALGNLIVGCCIIFSTYAVLILLMYRDLSVFHQVFNVARVIFSNSGRKTEGPD
jgi:PST family polysaccharide transporter